MNKNKRCCCCRCKPTPTQNAIEKLLATIFKSRFNKNDLRLAITSIAEEDNAVNQISKMNIELNVGKKRLLKLSATLPNGKPARIDGPIRYSIEEGQGTVRLPDESPDDVPAEGAVLVLPSISGKKVLIIGLEDNEETPSPVRAVKVRAIADADLGDGVEPLVLDLDIDVISARASNIDATELGEEEDATGDEENPEDDAEKTAKKK